MPTAMKDIWGKDHSGLVLKEIAVSVSGNILLVDKEDGLVDV